MAPLVFEGKSIEECLKKASDKLQCDIKNIEYEVLSEGKKGLFGMVNQPYKIKAWVKENSEENIEKIDEVLEDIEKINVNIDGYCEIKRDNENIYLIVHSPKGEGFRVTIDQATKFVEENGIVNADFDAIALAVNKASGEPVKIADFDPAIYKDGEVKINISKDKMKAEAIITPPKGGNPVMVEQVIDLARREGIKVELNEEAIKEAVENKIYNKPICIAEGIPAKNGEDARIDYKFKPKKDKIKPKSHEEDGKVDFKKLDLIDNVVKGEVIGKKIPATSGEAGKNVLGEIIPATPGKDIILSAGKNVKISEDGTQLISEIDGEVVFKKNIVHVLPIHVVEGDVDYSTGDIDFVGSVIVKGSIIDGFTVKCKGDLEVNYSIGGAYVECGGDVLVEGGILGKEKGKVIANGNIIAKFIENSDCEAKEEIIVEKAIMNSKIRATSVHVTSSKGIIVGGEIQAEDEIEAPVIGSHLAVKTNLIVGISEELMKRLNSLEEEKNDIMRNLDKVNQAISMLKKIKERSGTLSQENLQKLSKTLNLKKQLENNLRQIEEELLAAEEQLENARGGRVRASKVIYPGVNVTIRKGILQVKDEIKFVTLVYEEGYVKIKPYK